MSLDSVFLKHEHFPTNKIINYFGLQANSGEWLGEISIMRNMGVKYELEVLFNHGLRFATDTYLKAKMEDFRLQDERAKRNRR
jgi:DNA topoisomerase VI subunit A